MPSPLRALFGESFAWITGHEGRFARRVVTASPSISTHASGSNPAASRPRSRPPAPVYKLMTLSFMCQSARDDR